MGGPATSQAPHIIYRRALGALRVARIGGAACTCPKRADTRGQMHTARRLGVAALSAGVAGAHVEQVVAVNGLAY